MRKHEDSFPYLCSSEERYGGGDGGRGGDWGSHTTQKKNNEAVAAVAKKRKRETRRRKTRRGGKAAVGAHREEHPLTRTCHTTRTEALPSQPIRIQGWWSFLPRSSPLLARRCRHLLPSNAFARTHMYVCVRVCACVL